MSLQVVPEDIANYIIRRWPILVGFGLLGALLAYGLSFRFPPTYEAKAILSFGLNYDRNPPLEQRERDLAEGKVVGLLTSDDVLSTTIRDVSNDVDAPSPEQLQDLRGRIRLIRKLSRWELIVEDESPDNATILANAWAEASENAFWQLIPHALRAEDLQTQLDPLEFRLAELATADNAADQTEEILAIEERITLLEAKILEEIELGKGLASFTSLNVSNLANTPSNPITRDVRLLVVAGSIIGILIGLVLLSALMRIQRPKGA